MQMKEKWVEKVENPSGRSNTWASRSRAVVFVNDSRVLKAPAGHEDAQLPTTTVRVFRQQSSAKSELRRRCPAAETPSCTSAAGETTAAGSTRSASRKLSANQKRGQSASRPISEREGGGQIWSGFFGGGVKD